MASLFPRGVAVVGLGLALIDRSNGNAITTGTLNGYVTLDNGVQTPMFANPTHKGLGQWTYNLTSGERDGKISACYFVHSGGVTMNVNIISDDQLGPGSEEVEINFNTLAAFAEFWVTPSNSNTVIASGDLDANGDAIVYLDPGTYYIYAQKVGVNFGNPRTITVV